MFAAMVMLLVCSAKVERARAADPVLVAAGDIASCASDGDEATAALLAGMAGTIATLGDSAYESGTAAEFAGCYDPSWGQYRDETRPAAGNHDYATAGAAAYYAYFGDAAGDASRGYYSYDLGSWHIVVINSNCSAVGGCGGGSPQEVWLRADLAAHPAACTLAYWHHPLFSSGFHGEQTYMRPIWRALYEAGADVVLNGHDHIYERFAPQTPDGDADAVHGVREFVVGTGGASHYPLNAILPNSEIQNNVTYGVLKMTLHESGYDWEFVPVANQTFTDSGSGVCHGAPPAAPPSVGGISDAATEPSAGAADAEDVAVVATRSDGQNRDWVWAVVAFGVVVVGGGAVVAVVRR
jgi:acid phosphatase type 7